MNYYPDEIIEEVRLNNDLAEVVSEYVRLEKKGGGYFGLCPFHREKTPSFHVEPVKQFYFCFGCQNGGNVFHFIMNIENLDFPEALRFLADRAHMVLPEPEDQSEQHKIRLRKTILEANKQAARFFYSNLTGPKGNAARQYFLKRGLSYQTIKRFGLGYACDEWDALSGFLTSKRFEESVLIESGLSLKSKKDKLYDRFRGRVMFPIFDIRGNIVAFGGRVLNDALPKYVNSPETLVYSKGRELFGMNLAKRSTEKKLLIVEGYMDVIALQQAGIDFAVASLGTSLTNMQGRVLRKYADEIIISYDADTAGKKATDRGLEILNQLGCRVKVLQIPDGKDPDEFIQKKGPDEFKKLIDRAISLLEYRIRKLKEKNPQDTADGRMAFLNGVADLLVEQENVMEREMLMKNISRDYDITMDTLQAEIERRIRIKGRKDKKKEFNKAKQVLTGSIKTYSVQKPEGKRERYEKMLIALLCKENHLFKIVTERYPVTSFMNGTHQEMASILYPRLTKGEDFKLEEFITRLEPEKASSLVHMVENFCHFEEPERAMTDMLQKLEMIKLEDEKKDILARLKNITDMDEKIKLQQQLQAIIRRMSK